MAILKARSRLSSEHTKDQTPNHPEVHPAPISHNHSETKKNSHRLAPSSGVASTTFSIIKKWWWCLVLILFGYSWWFWLVTHISPTQLQNWGGLNQGYLPFQISLLLGNLGLFCLIFRSIRRGLFLSLCIQTVIALKLQSVIIDFYLLITILVFFGILELSASLISTLKLSRNQSHKPTTVHRAGRS
jgi:hypothetical protein